MRKRRKPIGSYGVPPSIARKDVEVKRSLEERSSGLPSYRGREEFGGCIEFNRDKSSSEEKYFSKIESSLEDLSTEQLDKALEISAIKLTEAKKNNDLETLRYQGELFSDLKGEFERRINLANATFKDSKEDELKLDEKKEDPIRQFIDTECTTKSFPIQSKSADEIFEGAIKTPDLYPTEIERRRKRDFKNAIDISNRIHSSTSTFPVTDLSQPIREGVESAKESIEKIRTLECEALVADVLGAESAEGGPGLVGCNQKESDRLKYFDEISKEARDLFIRKDRDYGSSFEETFDDLGPISALTRIVDKVGRLKTLTKTGKAEVSTESMEDTLIDLSNYAIMTIMSMRRNLK